MKFGPRDIGLILIFDTDFRFDILGCLVAVYSSEAVKVSIQYINNMNMDM